MKKTLLTIILSLILLISSAQTNEAYYKAVSTELYVKNEYTNAWDIYQKNATTNITVVIEENFVSIQAQKPTIYRIYKDEIQQINTDKLIGSRYTAKDLKTNEWCTIDVVRSKSEDNGFYLISIIVGKINLRYFVQ